ncbi:MAG: ABC transporter permease subunit [Christensenellales bacterium]|nr:ABC transporter permease subunit [Christensenellales bacterium]
MSQLEKVAAPRYRKKKWRFTQDDFQLLLLSLPTTIWYLLFSYIPMFGILIAFKKYKVAPGKGFMWSLINNSPWCGLENFKFLFSANGDTTVAMFRNTVLYNIVFICLGILIPVSLAIMISHLYSKRLAKICQTMVFLPHFLSWVVVGYFVYAFLATKEGLINNILISFGLEPISWYQAQALPYWPFILVLLNVWKSVGYNMIVYLASISGIDTSMYEAAVIDGASKHEQTRYITLPQLKPVIIIMFIMAVGHIFNSDFGLFYRSTRNSASLYDVYVTLDVYVYNALFNSSIPTYGYASAAGFLQSVLGCLTLIGANAIVRRVDSENAFF